MRFRIQYDKRNRIRVHVLQTRMSVEQADALLFFLEKLPQVKKAKVYETTCDAVVIYSGNRRELLKTLRAFCYEDVTVPDYVAATSGRRTEAEYREKLIAKTARRLAGRLFLPAPIRAAVTTLYAMPRILEGLQCLRRRRLEVSVLDATAIGVSLIRGDFDTAGSVIFLLGIGDLLEEWTHKKSTADLARTMALPSSQVWMLQDGQEIQVPVDRVHSGDTVMIHMGNVIPFDGEVTAGEGEVNQASMTGEALPVRKAAGTSVFAGTVLEDGELTVLVRETRGDSRYEKIVRMIEESEQLKSALESRAEHLADRLVPWTFAGTALTYLMTGNVTRALSVLMVDFSCALKLAMPVSVLSAIREAGSHQITVKGGRYLEQMAGADTIVFDKTGTLTKAQPKVAEVISFDGSDTEELLRIAACLEEHFPHSMAKAVVQAAKEAGLVHEEMHTKVEYVVAHGIASSIGGKRACIGSYHFIFEDEGCHLPDGMEKQFQALPPEYSHLFLAINQQLAGVICIEDPLRPEAKSVIRNLRSAGFRNIVMMTGDSRRTAERIAGAIGVDDFYAEVLPEEKARFVERERAAGRTVVMVGDGINDSPALSAADVGIAISDGAEIAREIADITIHADDLQSIVLLKEISNRLMRKIHHNYRFIVSFNSALIGLGVLGVIPPATSALLHNSSTLVIGLKSMRGVL